jgi:hypothetical protein
MILEHGFFFFIISIIETNISKNKRSAMRPVATGLTNQSRETFKR